jgi:hypothetical protein
MQATGEDADRGHCLLEAAAATKLPSHQFE